MVARTLSLKGKLPLRKIWNKNSASFLRGEEPNNNKNGSTAPTTAKSKRPRTCRVNKDEVEGIAFVRKSDLQFGPLLGEGGFAQVFGLFNSCSIFGDTAVVTTPKKGGSEKENAPNHNADPTQDTTEPQRQYAVKTIRKGLLEDKVLFQKAADDLVTEAEILARLDHPHIITLRGMSEEKRPVNHPQRYTNFFLLLDRLSETLSDRIQYWKDCKPLLDTKIDYAYQLAQALTYLHSKRILFRDIKPENIGFSGTIAQDDHKLQLFDFGMARELPTTTTTSSSSSAPPLPPKRPPKPPTTTIDSDEEFFHLTVCGTQRYMSHEVLLDGKYTLKSDCYTWAMVVWEMIAEAKPFHYMTPSVHKILVCQQGDRPPLSCYGLPPVVQDLLKTSWAHKVADRLPMAAVCQQLKAHVEKASPPPPSQISVKRTTTTTTAQPHRRTNSHGFFDTASLFPVVSPVQTKERVSCAAATPKSQNVHRRTNSHGSFPRIPLGDLPKENSGSPKKGCTNSHSFFSPSSTAPRIPTIDYDSPPPNPLTRGRTHSHRRSNSHASSLPTNILDHSSSPPKHRPVPVNPARIPPRTKSSNAARVDLASPEDKRNSFVTSKPALGKLHRRNNSHSSSLANNIITRITRVPMELYDSYHNDDESTTSHTVSPSQPQSSPEKPHRRNKSVSSFLTNNVITRITRVPSSTTEPAEEPASFVSPDPKKKMNSPERGHRRSSSHGSFYSESTTSRTNNSLDETGSRAQASMITLKSSASWEQRGPSLTELQDRKKGLKEQLKQYDITFAQKHGRMPNKAEKELIRPMYDHYNGLKSHIGNLESLKNKLKHFDMAFARKHGRMPKKVEKEVIREWYDRYKVLKNEIALFVVDFENSRGSEEARQTHEMVCGPRSPAFVTFHSFDSDLTPEIEVAEL